MRTVKTFQILWNEKWTQTRISLVNKFETGIKGNDFVIPCWIETKKLPIRKQVTDLLLIVKLTDKSNNLQPLNIL